MGSPVEWRGPSPRRTVGRQFDSSFEVQTRMNVAVLARWTLAALMLLGATTVSVVHRHGAGGFPHAHGWGVWRFGETCSSPGGCERSGLEKFHRHWLVFGFEVCEFDPSTPAPWSNTGTPAGGPQDQCRIGAAVEAPRPAASVDEVVSATDLLALPILLAPPRRPLELWAGAFRNPLAPPPSSLLCDAARLERTGVLNA